MKVWVLMYEDYDGSVIPGVYADAETAKAYLPGQKWTENQDGAFVNGGYSITGYDLIMATPS